MERITHQLIQGSPEWIAYRSVHDNASDAAAMLGISPHKTRDDLLKERYLGLHPEFSDYVQAVVLEPGHQFEALARPMAEEIMEESLFAATISYGEASASFDGITFESRKHWEHKRLSSELLACMPEEFNSGADLPKYHRVQVEQQFMVGDTVEALFSASKWNGDQLLDIRHAWCYPDPALRSEIEAGWAQFHRDLAVYKLPEKAAPKAVGKTMDSLPALFVMVEGKVTSSNLTEWKAQAQSAIRSVNRDLSTDQDFATAANMIKWCERVEEDCDTARTYTLSQTTSIADALKALDDVQADARLCRLELKKLADKRKLERKEEIIGDAVADFHKHVAELNAGLAPYSLPTIPIDIAGQTARKSSFDSMQSAVNTELARAKVAATTMADAMKSRRALIEAEPDFAFLFNDAATLIHKDAETVALIIRTRIADHKAAKAAEEAAQRERIAAEEKTKAEAAARAQAAEILRQEREAQEARAQAERDEQKRIADAEEAERQERADQEAADRRSQDDAARAERDRAESDLHKLGQTGAPVASAVAESIVSSSLEMFEAPRPIAGAGRVNRPAVASELAQEEHAWINIGKMNEAFGYTVTADLIAKEIGIQWTRTEKAAKFWTPTQFEEIKRRLAERTLKAIPIPF